MTEERLKHELNALEPIISKVLGSTAFFNCLLEEKALGPKLINPSFKCTSVRLHWLKASPLIDFTVAGTSNIPSTLYGKCISSVLSLLYNTPV